MHIKYKVGIILANLFIGMSTMWVNSYASDDEFKDVGRQGTRAYSPFTSNGNTWTGFDGFSADDLKSGYPGIISVKANETKKLAILM